MNDVKLALQSAHDALKDCSDKLAAAVAGLDRLIESGNDPSIPASDVERLHAQALAMLRTLDRLTRSGNQA